jgi:hypothetical protein
MGDVQTFGTQGWQSIDADTPISQGLPPSGQDLTDAKIRPSPWDPPVAADKGGPAPNSEGVAPRPGLSIFSALFDWLG